jgi:hypothetical protein
MVPEDKIYSAGEDQQHFIRPNDREDAGNINTRTWSSVLGESRI